MSIRRSGAHPGSPAQATDIFEALELEDALMQSSEEEEGHTSGSGTTGSRLSGG